MTQSKQIWQGKVVSIQPRIRLWWSFDQRAHTYLGYNLTIDGLLDGMVGIYTIAIGKAAHAKHQFRVGDVVQGRATSVVDERKESAAYDKVSHLKLVERSQAVTIEIPPYHGVPPELETYQRRGHRRLSARTYATQCQSCIWGCRMPVEMVIDQWNPSQKRYRFETFCYGSKSCTVDKAGPTRKVLGRRGMSWEEEDWVDADAPAHRGADE